MAISLFVSKVVQVAFQSADEAREAANQLNGYELRGVSLRVERLMDKKVKALKASGGQSNKNLMSGNPVMQKHTEFPLRILVLSEMVGAIIGRQGATIRTITQQVRTPSSLYVCVLKLYKSSNENIKLIK